MKKINNRFQRNRIKLIIYCIFAILFFSSSVSLARETISTKINIPQSFHEGGIITFGYELFSKSDTNVVLEVGISCPLTNIPIESRIVKLQSGKTYIDNFEGIFIGEDIKSQECQAYVKLLSPIQETFSKSFLIITEPSFSFTLQICNSASCLEKSKIFLFEENIYLDYISGIQNPEIIATLTYPSKKQEQITLPYSSKPGQIGTYNLEVIASKEGYKTITKKTQFGVIEKEANIPYVKIEKEIKKPKEKNYILYAGIFILLIVLVIFIINHLKKKK